MTPEEIAKLPYRPCVGVMLVNTAGHVFVGQRIDSEVAAWQMPQGGIDPGETPQIAAIRELWEETGVTADLVTIEAETAGWVPYDLPHDLVPKIWKGHYRGQEQKWVLMRFNGTDDAINIASDHPAEHKQLFDDMMRYFEKVGARIPKRNPDYDPTVYKNANEYEKRIQWGPFENRRPLEEDER